MAFGFTPKFAQDYELNGLSREHYLIIALKTAKKLGWEINYTSRSGFIAYIGGGLMSTAEEFTLKIADETVALVSKTISSGMVDWGKNKAHLEEFAETFATVQQALTEEQLDVEYGILSPSLPPNDEDKLLLPPPTAKQNFMGFLSFFIPRNGYFITPIIIDLNIAVFALMVIIGVDFMAPTTEQLVTWGANFRPATIQGEWWRLLTNTFLHIGIFHLLLNMYALLYIGLLLEPYLGKARFTAAYLITGILASLTSVYWHPLTVSAGASGAIFGMYGVFLAMLTTNVIDKSVRKALLTSIGVFVVLNLANGVKAGIDNAAHIGGLASGLIIGYAFYISLKKPHALNIKYVTIALLIVAASATSIVVAGNISSDINVYDKKMNDFVNNEAAALQVFKDRNAGNQQILTDLTTGIKYWNKNLQIINDVEKLGIPVELRVKDGILKQYCDLRIKSYQTIYKAVSESSDKYKDEITSYNQQIEAIIASLKKQ